MEIKSLGLVWLVAILSAAFPVAGQEAAPAHPSAAAPAPAPVLEFIPVPLVPEKTEELQQRLRRLGEAVGVEPAVAAIEAELPAIGEQISLRLEQTETLLASRPTLDQLRDFESDWTGRTRALAPRRQTLARRATELEHEVEELAELRKLWSASRENAANTEAPPQVLAAIGSNIESIDAIDKKVRARRSVVLTLLTSVSEREFEASDAGQRVSAAMAELRAHLFEPDAAPLWSAIRSVTLDPALASIERSTTSEWDALLEFAASRRRVLIPVGLSFPVALILAIFVRERMRRRIGGQHLEGSASAFERPWSVAFLVAAFGSAAAFPFAPAIAFDFIGMILVVPIFRILTPVLPKGRRGLLLAVAVFYIIDRVRGVLTPAELLERIVFFGEMIAALVAAAFLARRSRLTVMDRDRPPLAAVGAALWISSGAFLVAASSILLGYVSFGKLIGEGALWSIYLALAAYAAYRIGTTLVLVALTSDRLARIGVIHKNSEQLVLWTERALAVLAVVFWGLGTLDGFTVRDSVVKAVQAFLSVPIEVGTVSVSIGDILAFPLTLFIAFTLSRAIRSLLEEDVFPRVSLRRGVGNAVSTSVHYVLVIGGFFIALGAAGIDLGRFTLLAGAFGVGIGFGLQNVVNNFVSGLILLYERPIQVGDMIELGGLLGEVKRIGIRASTVLTFQGAEVIIPNGSLLSDQLINWTLSNKHRRVEIPVGVAYGNRPADVVEVLKRVVEGEQRVLKQPEPMILFRGFGDSSLDFEIRFWARDYMTYMVLASDVASAVYDELERVGITIPFPQRDLHLKSVDAGAAAKLRGGDEKP